MENQKVEVKINNAEYVLVTNEPEEYVQRVAVLVNKRMAQLRDGNKHLSTAMTAVLTSINLADDLLKAEAVSDGLREQLSRYTEDSRWAKDELEAKKLEVEKLKEDMHKLQIELAKRETELSALRRPR